MMFVLALLALVPMAASGADCPRADAIAPCRCQEVPKMVPKNFEIVCPGIDNAQTLAQVTLALRDTPHFYKFTIRGGNFMFIPQDVFKGLSFMEFEIADSVFNALTDTDRALEGLEGALLALVIKNSTVLGVFDWLALRHLRNMARIEVDVDMGDVPNDLSGIEAASRISALTLSDNHIAHLDNETFISFVGLKSLSLRNNRISVLTRSMLPNPANSLLDLDFGGNEISRLPADFFDNMPNLRNLYMDKNKLYYLSEQPFSTIWSQIKFFHAPNNNIRCDCRMLWITQQAFPRTVNAQCEVPRSLKGKNLKQLVATDLWC